MHQKIKYISVSASRNGGSPNSVFVHRENNNCENYTEVSGFSLQRVFRAITKISKDGERYWEDWKDTK